MEIFLKLKENWIIILFLVITIIISILGTLYGPDNDPLSGLM